MKKTIIITGGHVTPALALIDELTAYKDIEIIFVGRKIAMEGDKADSYEYRQILERQIPFINLTTGRLQRFLSPYSFISLAKIPVGLAQSFSILAKYKPAGVVSFGGYLALPVALMAKLRQIPLITHEQTTVPGVANRVIARFADVICLSWPETKKFFPRRKIILTGNPLRQEFLNKKMRAVTSIKGRPIIYIQGGSLGAHVINRVVARNLPYLLEKYLVVHQCGDSALTKDWEFLNKIKDKLINRLAKWYVVRPYFSAEEVVWLFKNAKLVVSRAGANTVTELLFMGKPALLIPLPHAGADEQRKNALLLVKSGIGKIMEQERLQKEGLSKTIENMLKNISQYERNVQKAKSMVETKAAKNLAEIVRKTIS